MSRTERQQEFASGLVGLTSKEQIKPSKFEVLVNQLVLDESQWKASAELRAFAEEHKDRCYVPEYLLRAWALRTIYTTKPRVNHTH
jgi:hypothetical protein